MKWAEFERTAGEWEKAAELLKDAKDVFVQYDLPLFLGQLEKVTT
jgi:hypothetical protein